MDIAIYDPGALAEVNQAFDGYDAIRAFREGRPAGNLAREVTARSITTFGADFAVANIEFRRPGSDRTGRQSQTWVRMPEGWRVVAAHVSLMS